MMKSSLSTFIVTLFLIIVSAHGSTSRRNAGIADNINKLVFRPSFQIAKHITYSDFQSFGSVLVRCPIEKTWATVGNGKTWFRAVIGESLLNITIVKGNGRKLGSKFNYFVDGPGEGPPGRTQQRLLRLSDFDYNLVTTFDSSTLPLFPWTTFVTLDRVTYIDKPVDFTMISFAQQGTITAPAEQQEPIRQQIQSLFNIVFAPSLKAKFDDCE